MLAAVGVDSIWRHCRPPARAARTSTSPLAAVPAPRGGVEISPMTVLTSTPVATTRDTTGRPPRRRRRHLRLWLGRISLLGMAVRVMNVLWWRPTTEQPGYHGYRLGGDAFFYHWQANTLGEGRVVGGARAVGHCWAGATERRVTPRCTRRTWHVVAPRASTASPRTGWPRRLLGVAAIVVVGVLGTGASGQRRRPRRRRGHGRDVSGDLDQRRHAPVGDDARSYDGLALLPRRTRSGVATNSAASALLGGVCGATAMSRNELLALFPIVVIPLALLVTRHELAQAAPARGRRLRRRRRTVCCPGSCSTSPVRGDDDAQQRSGRRALRGELRRGRGTASTSGTTRIASGAMAARRASTSRSATRVPREEAIEYIERPPRSAAVGRRGTCGPTCGACSSPGRRPWLDWWIEGRGRAPSWIGLFCYYALAADRRDRARLACGAARSRSSRCLRSPSSPRSPPRPRSA